MWKAIAGHIPTIQSMNPIADYRMREAIADALGRGDIVVRAAINPGAGLCNQMFSWASVRTLAARLSAHLPESRKVVVVVPSNSKIFLVFGKQVCWHC